MEKTTEIIRSDSFLLLMYVMSFTCDFGTFEEGIVSPLRGLTLSATDNASWFYFSGENLGCVSGGNKKEYML